MRGNAELKDLGVDVLSIRRSQKRDMILELKKGIKTSESTYKELAVKALGGEVQVRALTTVVTLQVRNLDEISGSEEVALAIEDQCHIEVEPSAIRLRKGPAGTQVATLRVSPADAKTALKVAKIKVGWSVCPLSELQPPSTCFKCFEGGHMSWSCKGPDESSLCRRCGKAGHIAKDCTNPYKCLICSGKRDNKHAMGVPRCPAAKQGQRPQS